MKRETETNMGRFNQVCFKQHPGGLSSVYVTQKVAPLCVAVRNQDTTKAPFLEKLPPPCLLSFLFTVCSKPPRRSLLLPPPGQAEAAGKTVADPLQGVRPRCALK